MKENTGHKQGGYMIDKIIGFIGAGNMGSAMIGGIVHSELVTTSQIIASAHSAATLEKLQSAYSIETPYPMKRLQNAVIFYFLL